MSGILTGLLQGINEAGDQSRADYQKREQEQFDFERKQLASLASDETVEPAIRQRATTALLEIAAQPNKRPKAGSYFARLLGTDPIQPHPVVTSLFDFMRSPEQKGGGLPMGLRPTELNPTAQAAAPVAASQPAAQATVPMSQPGGGPPSVAALGSPGGSAGPVAAPPQLPAMPLREVPGATSPQAPSAPVSVERKIFRTPEEIAVESATARAKGAVLGDVEGMVAAGIPRAEALELVKQERMRQARGGTGAPFGAPQDYELADGTPVIARSNRFTGGIEVLDPQSNQWVPAESVQGLRPRTSTGSTSMGADREALSRATYGRPFSQLSQTEQQDVLRREQAMLRNEAYATTLARLEAGAAGPLDTNQRFNAEQGLADDWAKATANFRTVEQQYGLMVTGLERFDADPVGASEAIRVTFEKILDPASVVRESEYLRQEVGMGVLDRIDGLWQRYGAGGGPIPKVALAEMVRTAQQFAQRYRDALPEHRRRIEATARRYQLDPSTIFGSNLGAAPPPPGPPPAVPAAPGNATPPPAAVPQGAAAGDLQTAPPNAPRVGTIVGNPYPADAEVRQMPDGTFRGRVNGQTVVLRETAPGSRSFVY